MKGIMLKTVLLLALASLVGCIFLGDSPWYWVALVVATALFHAIFQPLSANWTEGNVHQEPLQRAHTRANGGLNMLERYRYYLSLLTGGPRPTAQPVAVEPRDDEPGVIPSESGDPEYVTPMYIDVVPVVRFVGFDGVPVVMKPSKRVVARISGHMVRLIESQKQ